MMTSVQTQMNQKADQLFKDVVFKFSRTWVWPATTSTTVGGGSGTGTGTADDTTTVITPTPFSGPPSPGSDRYDNATPEHAGADAGAGADNPHKSGEEEEEVPGPIGAEEVGNFPPSWLDALVENFDPNGLDLPFFKDGQVDLEACFEGVMNSGDSAYGTLPTSEGQHGSYGLGGLGMAWELGWRG